jgi:hypothetical protein
VLKCASTLMNGHTTVIALMVVVRMPSMLVALLFPSGDKPIACVPSGEACTFTSNVAASTWFDATMTVAWRQSDTSVNGER